MIPVEEVMAITAVGVPVGTEEPPAVDPVT